MPKRFIMTLTLALVLAGCGGGQVAPDASGDATATPPATLTPVTLAPTLAPGGLNTLSPPTLTPSPEGNLAPTALPAPTQIVPQTPTPEAKAAGGETTPAAPAPGGLGPGISLNPALGEPGEIIIVDGEGFGPSDHVTLHWAKPDGPTGPVYYELEADAQGAFNIGLIIPPADKWPGGPPQEMDYIQLRAFSDTLGDFYYWANFRYVKRFEPGVSLVLTYKNTDYGYQISVPNAWTWTWEGDDTSNVRFKAPSGSAKGFIRVVNGTNVNAAIQSIMAVEAPGQNYNTGDVPAGKYPGTQVTASQGLVVWFIPSKGRIYAISFTNEAGQMDTNIASSFTLN